MSASAPADNTHASNANHAADAEMYRWMRWFGLPVALIAVLVGAAFGTGDQWWLGAALLVLIADIFVLVWLAMSSDTNGVLGDAPSHH
ncbi:MAG: hypothetical protein WCH31_02535 [Actinomycetes bacterium]